MAAPRGEVCEGMRVDRDVAIVMAGSLRRPHHAPFRPGPRAAPARPGHSRAI